MEKQVKDMIEWEVTGDLHAINNELKSMKLKIFDVREFWSPQLANIAMGKVYQSQREGVSYDSVMAALKDEFRVQIIQYSKIGFPGGLETWPTWIPRSSATPSASRCRLINSGRTMSGI